MGPDRKSLNRPAPVWGFFAPSHPRRLQKRNTVLLRSPHHRGKPPKCYCRGWISSQSIFTGRGSRECGPFRFRTPRAEFCEPVACRARSGRRGVSLWGDQRDSTND